MSRRFYITTPIYYVNDRPHIGHTYTTVLADVIARHRRMMGEEVYFLTGTDEHGQKIEKTAAARGITPKALADEVVPNFRDLWARMGITNDYFVRTTDAQHKAVIQDRFRQLLGSGDIYKDTYRGSVFGQRRGLRHRDPGQGDAGPGAGPPAGGAGGGELFLPAVRLRELAGPAATTSTRSSCGRISA